VHDCKLLEQTIDSIVVERPEPTEKSGPHLCLDKGYDNPTGQAAAESRGHTPRMWQVLESLLCGWP
jgi:hypothetical protein